MKKASNIYIIAILAVLGVSLFTACNKEAIAPTIQATTADSAIASEPDSSGLGLITWYPFNDTAGDYSGNGNPSASVYNISSTTDRNGYPDQAYHFDGVSSYLKIANNPVLCLNNTDFTINVWVKMDSYGGLFGSAIIGKRGDGPANGWFLSIANTPPKTTLTPGLLTFYPGSTDLFGVDTTAISLNRWYMLTTMYNSTLKQTSIYLNGVLNSVTANINTPAANTTADIYVGRDNPGNASDSYFFKGSIDDLRIYNRTLSVSELKKLMLRTD